MNVALQDWYAKNLQQNLGYPLRCPNPSNGEGLRIGDVGHVDENGVFHVLCNVQSPSRSDQFQTIPLDDDLICKNPTSVIPHLFSTGVRRDIGQESGTYKFTATTKSGAILILPSGAKCYELQDRQKLDEFQDLAIKHARRWYRSAGHNSLYLITGLYQTSSWTLGSFYGRRDVDGKQILIRKSVDDDDLVAYKWEPEFPHLDPQSCRKGVRFENQTVLIKGFKMKIRPTLGVTVVEPVHGSQNWFAPLLQYVKCLASQFGVIILPTTSIQPYPELSREPHCLDVINDYLLEENSDADVAITRDVWIKMLEKSESMVMQGSALPEHIKGEYHMHRSSSNAIWLQQRQLEDSKDMLVQETVSSESQVVVMHICAENVPVGLGYVPVGFFVRVEVDGGICWWTENKPALVDNHNIEWNDRIYLPSASSTKVRMVLCASFEFSPMLGSGEPLGTLEIHVSDLFGRTRPFTIKDSLPCSLTLLVSAQRWYGNHCSSRGDDDGRQECSTLLDVTNLTDKGHHALLDYYRNHDETYLGSSVALFTQALDKCPRDDPRRAATMFNLAKAQFLFDQFHHAHQNFHDCTSLFREALRLRAGDHRDRPMTLLYLLQALLYYRASGLQIAPSILDEYINELETICPWDTHARRAADLVPQTYELDGLQISDDLRKLNELIFKWIRAADEVPEGYFDKPIRFDNIGLALQRHFQLCHETIDLERAVTWFEKAVQTTPDGHVQKSTYADHVNDARLYQWATVALTNSSANEVLSSDAAAEFDVPKLHVYWGICDVLEGSGRVLEAIECFHRMQAELLEMHTPRERAWEADFRRRCVDKANKQGSGAMASKNYELAIGYYSSALSLDPTNVNIIVKCCEATEHHPSSYIRHGRKHTVLNRMSRYKEAFKAFEVMLSRMDNSSDPRVRDMRNQYLDATPHIRIIVEETIRDISHVFIDTVTGLLCDKGMQAAAFEQIPIFDVLRSSMTTPQRLDEAHIKKEVEKFYEYVMLSHNWQPYEPTFQMVEKDSVYRLPASPTNDKLINFCKLVRSRGFRWAWSDTCCINQSDWGVQQKSVTSMFRWYCRAALTIVHLLGVHSKSQRVGSMKGSIWNMRGWTLLEYVASRVIQIYTEDWKPYLDLKSFNHKESTIILSEMKQATNFATEALATLQPGLTRVREKLYLASKRQTTREEDIAYCLFGIFNATLPVLYGEGKQAIGRLLEYILTRSDNVMVLAWTGTSSNIHSYFPSDLTVYDQVIPPHIPLAVQTSEMDRMVLDVKSRFPDLSLILELYNGLHNLPPLSFTAGRLQLVSLVFPMDDLKLRSECDSDTIHQLYRTSTTTLGDVRIETKEELAGMKGLVLIHPWINPLIDEDFSDSHPQFDHVTRSLQLLVRLRQPFGVLLLASRGRMQYKRVATDSFIKVQVRSETSLKELMRSIRTVDVQ